MNYLNRPIFTWFIDWAASITRSINYDLRETKLGFGAEFYLATETYTAQGWDFEVALYTPAEIAAMETFTASLYGRLHGFWLPVPMEMARIKAAHSATQFDIYACGLTATWQDRPDIQLWFTHLDGSNPQGAAITAVVDNGDGTERVTIDTALNVTPAMIVRRLHYVRLLDDAEKGQFEAEGWLTRSLSVIELPLEYAQVETGRQPIYLYQFSADAPVALSWTYTSFAANVWSLGTQFLAFPMTHGQLAQTARGDKDELDIEAKPSPDHPFNLFFPSPFGATMKVTVWQTTLGNLDSVMQVFSGVVLQVEDQGIKFIAHCSSLLYLLDRKIPRMQIQPTCNYALFDRNCGKLRADFEITVIITAINNDPVNGPSIVAQLAYIDLNPTNTQAKDWFAGGSFETGFGLGYEPRTITGSIWNSNTNHLKLSLNLPLWKALVGSYCQITAGCNGLAATCKNKFNNYARFGGHPAVPQNNLTLQAFNNLPVAQGGKK